MLNRIAETDTSPTLRVENMNVCVQCASSGSPEIAAASRAAAGAASRTLHPR
jgi:hypothetical protein